MYMKYIKNIKTALEEFNLKKSNDLIELYCIVCNSSFFKPKGKLLTENKQIEKGKIKNKFLYCSKECTNLNRQEGTYINCMQCNKLVYKSPSQLKAHKHHFCNSSCSTSYNNKFRKPNYISKLEKLAQKILTSKYPDLKFNFNNRTEIGLELDIYIPSLRLAFELNGIYHYEPIYGIDKFNKVVDRDKQKYKICRENNISLCVINTSSQKRVTEKSSQKYLDIIFNIIEQNLSPICY